MAVHLTVSAFVCAVLVLLPLPMYWRARNIGILSIITWLFLVNFTRGVNSIVWAGNVVVQIPVWCDITTKFVIGASVGLPAAFVCICRFLSHVASPHHMMQDANDKRRRKIIELVLCIGLPVVFMLLHFIVQANRFFIIEDFGCQPYIYMSIPALFIIYLPPVILSAIAMVYAAISLRWFIHRRRQFQAVLQSSQTGLTTGRYLRLITLSFVLMVFVVGMMTFTMVNNIMGAGIQPWVSWDYVHADWMRIDQIIKVLAAPDFWQQTTIAWYIIPVASVVFFALFGIGQEANAEYRKAYLWVKTTVFRIKPTQNPVLPISARSGALNSMTTTTPTIIKLETETTVSGEKWDDVQASSIHTTSRPETPREERKDVIESEVRQ